MPRLYLTQEKALERYNLSEEELNTLIREDRVRYVTVRDVNQDTLVVYDNDLADYAAERDIKPEDFDNLRGNLLGMNESCTKYDLPMGTTTRWVQQGLLEIQGYEKNKKLVNEADVAYLVKLAKAKKIGPGRKIL